MNFTNSLTACQRLSGSLAHIVSEYRTIALSDMVLIESLNSRNSNLIDGTPIATAATTNEADADATATTPLPPPRIRLRHAWCGLQELKYSGKFFTTTETEPLDCFLYRAWHPGHPR